MIYKNDDFISFILIDGEVKVYQGEVICLKSRVDVKFKSWFSFDTWSDVLFTALHIFICCYHFLIIHYMKKTFLFLQSSVIILFCVYVVVQSLSHVQLFATHWTTARWVTLSFPISRNSPKFLSIESVILSNHFILCHPSPFAFNLSQHQGLFQWIDYVCVCSCYIFAVFLFFERTFLFFLILLRNNWDTSLCKFKLYNMMVWFTYFVKWLPQ